MTPTTYQKPEIRDANDNIIQQGAFGKNTALANSTNDGWIDYVANDLEFLYDLAKDEVVPVPSLPASGQLNKTYLLTTTGVSYRWSGTEWVAVSSSEAVGRAESAALLAEQWATKTDGSVDGTEYSAKYYAEQAEQSADDAQDVADDMAGHLVQIDKNTGGVAKNSKRISNIEKLLQGNLYDYDTDDDSAYVKDVPSGALPYAGLEKIGGKTVVWNQLNPNNGYTQTINGLTYTKNNDGSWTLNGTSTDTANKAFTGTTPLMAGHKYYIHGCPAGSGTSSYTLGFGGINTDTGNGGIWTATASGGIFRFNCVSGVTFNNVTMYPQYHDLTLMFGAGNEPTADECRAMFPPSAVYPKDNGTLLSAGVTSVVSKDSNDDALQTLSIPTAIQQLEGYGWSAGNVYNYIDYERKVFVKNVARVDMDTLTWTYQSASTRFYTVNLVSSIKSPSAGTDVPNILCVPYPAVGLSNSTDKTIYVGSTGNVFIKNLAFTDAQTFTASLDGIYLFYELATPIETDISQYLTDNLIEVGAGGTLTFPNSNGNDYHIPVPSEVTYMIDLQEAVANG